MEYLGVALLCLLMALGLCVIAFGMILLDMILG